MKKLLMIFGFVFLLLGFVNTSIAASWNVPGDFADIQAAIDSSLVINGDRIIVEPGERSGALVTKSVEIKGEEGAIINDGPLHPAGLTMGFRLLAGSEGATISHFTFDVDLAIMNGEAVDNVTVTQCTFNNAIQGISNWCGNGWEISHNVINDLRTRSGGGIGILIADYSGGFVEDNVVSHNKISGTLNVNPDDCGGYCGSGIVIYADFRWGNLGAEEIKNNRVVKNKISMVSDTPGLVDIVAFELTDTSENGCPIIFENAIGFNDFRGTEIQIALTPDNLDTCNKISRNLGDNRGHGGDHPSVFGPGGN